MKIVTQYGGWPEAMACARHWMKVMVGSAKQSVPGWVISCGIAP